MTIHIAVVGAGLAAHSHALDIVTDPALHLAGVATTRPDSAARFADTFGGQTYPGVDAIAADPRVDAVVVAVPPTAVFDVLERLDPDKPCLVEKPVPVNAAERHRLSRVISHRMVVPFNRRYQPSIRNAAEHIRSGSLGAVIDVDARWRGPYQPRFASGAGTYRSSAGPRHGVLVDTGSHALDVVALLLGGLPHPNELAARFTYNPRGTDIAAEVELRGDPPIHLAIVDDPAAPDCGDWSVTVTCQTGVVHLAADGHRIHTPSAPPPHLNPAAHMERPVTDLIRILDGAPPLGASTREVLAIGDLVIAAHDTTHSRASRWIRPRSKALGRLNGSC